MVETNEANPYEPPRGPIGTRPDEPRPFSVARAFSIVVASGIVGSVVGTGLGYLLGHVTPAYYRGVFKAGADPGFDPVQVGLGLGFSQGLICGLLVGSAVVLAAAWSRRRAGGGEGPMRLDERSS